MLRASSEATEGTIDAASAVHGEAAGVPHGPLLVQFVEAVTRGGAAAADAARNALSQAAGPEAVVDAAAVLANFEMMTRVADSTGAVVAPRWMESSVTERASLGADGFQSVR